MALDEALMARARETGAILLRVYEWESPTLSLGRHQTARGLYDLDAARARGVGFVGRPTGGRAVLHHREITYSVAAPVGALGSLPESYRRINRLLLEALRRLGVNAGMAQPSGVAPHPGVAPCFEEPVAGEIVAGGRKLVGSAQWRDREALLQHGSILVDDDQTLASELLRSPVPLPPAPATLRGLTGRAPAAAEFAAALGDAVRAVEDAPADSLELDDDLMAAARMLTGHYESDAWTWRR
jgi:lipoate-protein ligase A